jgi:hypothetical protein
MKAEIHSLFPTALYVNTYEGDTSEVVKYFDSQEMNPASQAAYGEISKNSYIVNHPICKSLNDFFMKCFEEYATNTLLAGVFYYDVQPNDSAICFSKEVKSFNRSYLEPSLLDDYQQHPFSQEEIYFTPKQNNFIIFPSWLSHGVPPNRTNRVRKALGINALTKGTLGDQETISEIIFGRYA